MILEYILERLKKYIIAMPVLFKAVFAQTGIIDKEIIRSVIPQGFRDLAEQLGLYGEWAPLVLFFIVAAMGAGLFWIVTHLVFGEKLSDETAKKAVALVSIGLGFLLAYGVGVWSWVFYFVLAGVALVFIGYIGKAMYSGARGWAAAYGKFEMKMRKAMSKAKKDFLRAEAELKQIEADYKALEHLLKDIKKIKDPLLIKLITKLYADITKIIRDAKNIEKTANKILNKVILEEEDYKTVHLLLSKIDNVMKEIERVLEQEIPKMSSIFKEDSNVVIPLTGFAKALEDYKNKLSTIKDNLKYYIIKYDTKQ